MLRKCAVIFITVHLRQYGPSSQVVAASIVLSLSTSAQMYFLPYIDPKHNMIESFGLHVCHLQLLVVLVANMIGRVDRFVPQSPIGPVSTVIVIIFVFFSTAQFIGFAVYWTVKRSQTDEGFVGNISRCCGRHFPILCEAENFDDEWDFKDENKRKETQPAQTIGRSHSLLARKIRAKLKHNVKVALHMHRGLSSLKLYESSRAALDSSLQEKQTKCQARLRSRIVKAQMLRLGCKNITPGSNITSFVHNIENNAVNKSNVDEQSIVDDKLISKVNQ